VLKALTGIDGGIAGLLGLDGKGQGSSGGSGGGGGGGGPITSLAGSPMASTAVAMIQQQLTGLGEKLKTGLRQVRLTVGWKDGKATESFTLVTHQVVLTSAAQRRLATPASVPGQPLLQPPQQPGPPGDAAPTGVPGRRTPARPGRPSGGGATQ
jgi:hypothetical protein